MVRAVGAGGDLEALVSGPPHRYHPLIHDDCALCLQRRTALNQVLAAPPLPPPAPPYPLLFRDPFGGATCVLCGMCWSRVTG